MQPKNNPSEMDIKFESKDENTVSVYTEDANGNRNEVVRMHVMSEDEYAHFREITSDIKPTAIKS